MLHSTHVLVQEIIQNKARISSMQRERLVQIASLQRTFTRVQNVIASRRVRAQGVGGAGRAR